MNEIRKEPCSSCPYRCDVPSGVWAENEYEKLRRYDEPTYAQPREAFACHATPEHLCHGWAVVHGWELLALRLLGTRGPVELPEPFVALFRSGNEAADHGMADIEAPAEDAVVLQERLLRKHPRLKV